MDRNEDEYMVMLPFMAHGHLNPFLSLASLIRRHSAATTVVIAATPLNILYLKSQLSNSDPGLLFADLPSPSAAAAENTENLRPDHIAAFFHASLTLESPARDLLRSLAAARAGRPPLCVVHDVFLGWAARAAADSGAPSVAFSTGGAYGTAAYVSIWLDLPHRGAEGGEFAVPGFPERCRFHVSMLHPFLRAADGRDDWSRFFQRVIRLSMESDFWLCATAEEFEPLGLQILRNYLNTPVFCAGTGGIGRGRGGKELGVSAEECLKWLDSHAPRSVVYVSFGSQNTIGAPEMMALAEGLEMSGAPFIWAVRPPLGFDPAGEIRPEWLPEGFEGRARGLLVRGWAPQAAILGHAATGAFVSHCGWNSVLEAMRSGVPLVGWPIAAEQAYNAETLAHEKGVCIVLARGGAGTGLGPEYVASVVAVVMGSDNMRRRAELARGELTAAAAEGGSVARGIPDLLAALRCRQLGENKSN